MSAASLTGHGNPSAKLNFLSNLQWTHQSHCLTLFLLEPTPKSKPDAQSPRRRSCSVVVSRALWLMRVLADHKGEPGDLGKTLSGAMHPASLTHSKLHLDRPQADFPLWLLRPQKAETMSASSSTVIVRLGNPGLS